MQRCLRLCIECVMTISWSLADGCGTFNWSMTYVFSSQSTTVLLIDCPLLEQFLLLMISTPIFLFQHTNSLIRSYPTIMQTICGSSKYFFQLIYPLVRLIDLISQSLVDLLRYISIHFLGTGTVYLLSVFVLKYPLSWVQEWLIHIGMNPTMSMITTYMDFT